MIWFRFFLAQEGIVILVIVYQLFVIVIINVPVAVILKHSLTEKAVYYSSVFFATTFNVLVFYAPKVCGPGMDFFAVF
jgi:hypothetical protein